MDSNDELMIQAIMEDEANATVEEDDTWRSFLVFCFYKWS
jgi:hypothetical protein